MNLAESDETKGDILVVDDTPANLRVLSRLLSDNNYKVRPVPNGTLALEAVKAAPPDLILLDIRMPNMDGYEVCKILKQDDNTRDIPVIFISAMHELEDKVKGFEAGAVDFVTKPFQEGEVLIRLQTHLTIRRQGQRLAEQYDELRGLEIMRETLIQMIVHDLNNPLHGILGFARLISTELQDRGEDKVIEYAEAIVGSSRTIIDMIRAILDVSKIESEEMKLDIAQVDPQPVIEEVQVGLKPHLVQKEITIELALAPNLPAVRADPEILRRILVNLIGNAIKFSSEGGTIVLSASEEKDSVHFSVSDEGPGIPDQYRDKIFEKYGQIESRSSGRKYSTGLGLTFCKMAVEAQGGSVGVESEGKGSLFWFDLPSAKA